MQQLVQINQQQDAKMSALQQQLSTVKSPQVAVARPEPATAGTSATAAVPPSTTPTASTLSPQISMPAGIKDQELYNKVKELDELMKAATWAALQRPDDKATQTDLNKQIDNLQAQIKKLNKKQRSTKKNMKYKPVKKPAALPDPNVIDVDAWTIPDLDISEPDELEPMPADSSTAANDTEKLQTAAESVEKPTAIGQMAQNIGQGQKLQSDPAYRREVHRTQQQVAQRQQNRTQQQAGYGEDPDEFGDLPDINEGAMNQLDIMRQDLEAMTDRQFYTAYGISKAAFEQKFRTLLKPALDDKYNDVNEHIVKHGSGYRLLSHKGKNLGTFKSKAAAAKHEGEVEYFKHKDEVKEGWSDAIVSQRTGRPRTPYSVYIKGKKWRDFENDDHAEAVANKLRAKFKAEGRDPSVITIAPTDYDKDLREFAPGGIYKPPVIPREPGKEPFEDDPRSQTVSKVQQLLDAGKSVFVLLPGAKGRAIGTQMGDDHSWLNVQYKGWQDPKTRSRSRLTVNLKADDDASLTLTPGSKFTDNKGRPFDYTLSGQANTSRGLGMFGMEEGVTNDPAFQRMMGKVTNQDRNHILKVVNDYCKEVGYGVDDFAYDDIDILATERLGGMDLEELADIIGFVDPVDDAENNPHSKWAGNVIKRDDPDTWPGERGVKEGDDFGDLDAVVFDRIDREKKRLADLKKRDPEAYAREMAREKSRRRIPPVSTFEEDSNARYNIIRTNGHSKKDVFAGNYSLEKAKDELAKCLAHPLHTKYGHKFEIVKRDQQGVAEGIMDVIKQTFNDNVAGWPMGTSAEQFIQGWARDIKARTGKTIPVEKLTQLYNNYVKRSGELMQSHGTTDEGVVDNISHAVKGVKRWAKGKPSRDQIAKTWAQTADQERFYGRDDSSRDALRRSNRISRVGKNPMAKDAGFRDPKDPSKVLEAGSPAQQAAIAINMKKHHKKPKQVDEHGGGVNAMNKYVSWRRSANKERGITKHQPVGRMAEDSSTGGEAAERAILNRIMVAHTDLLKHFGPQKVLQAVEEVAYNVGDVDEIGTSDVSAWVHEVKQILGAE